MEICVRAYGRSVVSVELNACIAKNSPSVDRRLPDGRARPTVLISATYVRPTSALTVGRALNPA
ncbi:hypothetical protein QTP88_001500 [Uroleucon formosanum]